MAVRSREIAFVLLILGAGCAVHKPGLRTYRLSGRVLIPPGVASPDLPRSSFTANIAGRGPCAPAADAIAIHARKTRIRITVTREALLKQPRGWLSAWTALAESQGCIAPGMGLPLAA